MQIQWARVCASGVPNGDLSPACELKWEGESANATLWTDDIMLRTYWRAIDATWSCIWLSNANSNAIVITDLIQLEFPAHSFEARFPLGPMSRADARSRVRLGLEASWKHFIAIIIRFLSQKNTNKKIGSIMYEAKVRRGVERLNYNQK